MKFLKLLSTALVFQLIVSSISFSQIWEKTSDPPPGVNQFKFTWGTENGSSVKFIVGTDGTGAFKSTDDGKNWENIGLIGKILTNLSDKHANTGEFIATASDGVYKTTDGGLNWQQYTSGIEGIYIRSIARNVIFNKLYIGTVGNGVFLSTDEGETWEQYGTGLENKTIVDMSFGVSDGLFVVTQEDGVWQYNETNNTWGTQNNGNNNLVGGTAIAGDSQGNLILASSPNIYSSPNGPVSWQFETEFDFANDIAVAADGQVIVSSYGGGVELRVSAGVWIDFSDGLPADNDGYIDVVNIEIDENGVGWVAVDPFDPSIIGGIYKTVNPVADVEDISSEIPNNLN